MADHGSTKIGQVDSCPGGSDGLHPNALGDFQIARAYTKVLHEHFGYGDGPLAVPPVESIVWPGADAGYGDDGFMLHEQTAPTQLFVGAAGLCLIVVVAAVRRRRIRLDGKYLRLPMTVKDKGDYGRENVG